MVGTTGVEVQSIRDPVEVFSIRYSTVNPANGGTAGKVNAASQVFAGAVITGAVGYIKALTGALAAQAASALVAPAGVPPQASASAYLALTVWHPATVVLGLADQLPDPSSSYSNTKPSTAGAEGSVNIALQVLAG